MLREKSSCEMEEISTNATTYNDLYKEIDSKYSFDMPIEMIQVAVNDEYTSLNREILDGDIAVFIPPVAGG